MANSEIEISAKFSMFEKIPRGQNQKLGAPVKTEFTKPKEKANLRGVVLKSQLVTECYKVALFLKIYCCI